MKNQAHDSKCHLQDPRTRKWMVQCAACNGGDTVTMLHRRFFGRAHLERHFEALKLDDRGVCDKCQGVGAGF